MMKSVIMTMYYEKRLLNTDFKPFFNIQCGKRSSEICLGMVGDDTGENISSENMYWSEISGLYWFYKNFKDFEQYEYVGLCSYRRFFNLKKNRKNPVEFFDIAIAQNHVNDYTSGKIESLMRECDVITPIPYIYKSSINEICKINYNEKDFDILRKVIEHQYPDYMVCFDDFFFSNNKMFGHNMFIMKKSDFFSFCEWVFNILFAVQKDIDPSGYSLDKIRCYGYMHELLLNVYVKKNFNRQLQLQLGFCDTKLKGFKFNCFVYRLLCNAIFGFKLCLHRMVRNK